MLNEKQLLYKNSVEKLINNYIDFSKVDEIFEKISMPVLKDTGYNPYHMNSNLGSKYVYLRNNYYVDKLEEKDQIYVERCILNGELLSPDFILKTANQVLFEDGDYVMLNYNTMDSAVKSKSLMFEMAYDLNACTELDQIRTIEKTIKQVFFKMKEQLEQPLGISLSMVVYKAMPDLYKDNKNNVII